MPTGMACIYRSRPAGVAQSSHAFVGGTQSSWARWRIPVNKGRKCIRNANQALTVRGEHADRIVGSPSWWSSINYNRSMPEDLKLSQIGSSQLPPPFRGLHSPGVRKHCQIIFACYFRKSSIVRDIVTKQCTEITTLEEKGELKRNRTESFCLPARPNRLTVSSKTLRSTWFKPFYI